MTGDRLPASPSDNRTIHFKKTADTAIKNSIAIEQAITVCFIGTGDLPFQSISANPRAPRGRDADAGVLPTYRASFSLYRTALPLRPGTPSRTRNKLPDRLPGCRETRVIRSIEVFLRLDREVMPRYSRTLRARDGSLGMSYGVAAQAASSSWISPSRSSQLGYRNLQVRCLRAVSATTDLNVAGSGIADAGGNLDRDADRNLVFSLVSSLTV